MAPSNPGTNPFEDPTGISLDPLSTKRSISPLSPFQHSDTSSEVPGGSTLPSGSHSEAASGLLDREISSGGLAHPRHRTTSTHGLSGDSDAGRPPATPTRSDLLTDAPPVRVDPGMQRAKTVCMACLSASVILSTTALGLYLSDDTWRSYWAEVGNDIVGATTNITAISDQLSNFLGCASTGVTPAQGNAEKLDQIQGYLEDNCGTANGSDSQTFCEGITAILTGNSTSSGSTANSARSDEDDTTLSGRSIAGRVWVWAGVD